MLMGRISTLRYGGMLVFATICIIVGNILYSSHWTTVSQKSRGFSSLKRLSESDFVVDIQDNEKMSDIPPTKQGLNKSSSSPENPRNKRKYTNKLFYTRSKKAFRDKYNLLRKSSQVRYEVCNTFKYSPADWTLYELKNYDNSLENETCNNLYESLFKDEVLIYYKTRSKKLKRPQKRVKWIVHADGTIISLGCTKHTRDCEPGAFFDYKRQMRIDTPPCCRHKMMQVLEQVSNHLNERKVSYMVVGGFVISYVRSKEILHYDEDVDLYIDREFWKRKIFPRIMNKLTERFGFYQEWRRDGRAMSLQFSENNTNGLGMWDYTVDLDNHFRVSYQAPVCNASTLIPPQSVRLNNVKTKMPHKPVEFLNCSYKQWRREMNCKKKRNRKCV